MPRSYTPWLRLGWDAYAMGLEAAGVVGLRTLKIAAGGAAGQAEAQLMVEEKVQAALSLQTMAATGGLGSSPHGAARKALVHYRRRVRANLRRLRKG